MSTLKICCFYKVKEEEKLHFFLFETRHRVIFWAFLHDMTESLRKSSKFGNLGLFLLFWPSNVTSCEIPDRWMYDTTILILGSKFRFWALGAYFCLFEIQMYIISRSMDISHDNIDFGLQIPFLSFKGLFSPFWPLKVYFFLLHVKFPIDGYITRPYWFWAPNSVFGLWEPKSIYFLQLYKISDRLTYFIFEPPSAQSRDLVDFGIKFFEKISGIFRSF
jgi:hypothetical protein